MKAVVYDAPRSFQTKDIPVPQPGPGEVRIKVIQVGVCGTDLHIHNGDFQARFPLIPGHELVGTVDALGDGVTRVNAGEQVSVNPNVNCGRCEFCLAGRPIHCTLDRAGGLGIDRTVLIERGDSVGSHRAALDASDGRGYDIVVEATGSTAIGEICTPLTRNGGTVVLYGVTTHAETIVIHPFDVFRREITIVGSFAEITSFDAAIGFLRSGRIRTDGIITHRFGLDEYGTALETLRSEPTAHKVVIVA